MSKLLLDEHPLLVMPQLAAKIGLNESIILQQIHYWNEINKKSNNNFKDGHYWTFNSIKEWKEQFPFWSESTINRTITNLAKMKLVISGNYNKLKIDRTKWYRIDYHALKTLESSPFSQIDKTNMSKWHDHLGKMDKPLPEINPEINKENNHHLHIISENDGRMFPLYSEKYKEKFGKDHPKMTKEKMEELISNYEYIQEQYFHEGKIDNDEIWQELIDYHFDNLSSNNDGNILSFLSLNGGYGPIGRYIEELYYT
jgi:hypothetical protein